MAEGHAGQRTGQGGGIYPAASDGAEFRIVARRQLTLFAIACTAISGGFYLAAWLMGDAVTTWPTLLVYGLGASGPSLAALVMRIVGGRRHGTCLSC